uniref:Uncharacterized protein n=1 Tax=Arundo donax TaxID=35708 RepID=A0A0A9GRI8_ARUDO
MSSLCLFMCCCTYQNFDLLKSTLLLVNSGEILETLENNIIYKSAA